MSAPAGSTPSPTAHAATMAGAASWWWALLPALAAAGYAYGVARLTVRGDAWPVSRSLAAGTGLTALSVALTPPLVDSMRFVVHVYQHLLVAMLAPLLLALSAPVTLALRVLPRAGRRRLLTVLHSCALRMLTFAPVVVILDVGGLYVYYLTPLFAASSSTGWLHGAVHVHMFLTGCLLSWYLVGRDPVPNRPSDRTRVIVVAVVAGSHDVLAKVLYAHLLPHGGGSAEQIRVGAQVMFYGGDAIDVALAVAVMTAWYARTGRALTHQRRRAQRAGAGPNSTTVRLRAPAAGPDRQRS